MISTREQLTEDLVRTGGGDVAAFIRVYHATSAKIFGVVARILGRNDAAQEIVQEVYFRVWQKAGDFDREQGSPITWLVSIARNRALDERRRRQFVPLEDVPHLLEIASCEDITGAYIDAEEVRRIEACLARLEETERRALQLVYYQGFTREEAASRCCLTVAAVRSLIRQGLAKLKSCLTHG